MMRYSQHAKKLGTNNTVWYTTCKQRAGERERSREGGGRESPEFSSKVNIFMMAPINMNMNICYRRTSFSFNFNSVRGEKSSSVNAHRFRKNGAREGK